MKKSNIHKFLLAVSAFLIFGFGVRFGFDMFKYDGYNGSAPLYVYAIVRTVEFIVPSIILLIVAIFFKKKFSYKEENKNGT